MADLDLDWGGDLNVTASGDLSLVSGIEESNQHIVRRLLTSTRGYVWHLEYGDGLVERVGKVALASNIRALVRASLKVEGTVRQVPPPEVRVDTDETDSGLYNIEISYVSSVTGEATSLSYSVKTSR